MNRSWGVYLMTVACLGMLASIFASRGDLIWAIGFGALAAAYLGRAVYKQVRENQRHRDALGEHLAGHKTTSEKQQIVDNLLTTRKQLKGRRSSEVLLGLIIVVGIVYIYPMNGLLALAISVLFIPLGYLIIKQSRSISLIERGLIERGYSLQSTN
ncbi:hypothetical protein [Brooklawnia sp.]|uniref:hypothetical protein n=1 Tax=Brooklawnia sp. TaxID=2699740 RepID=UPI00311D86DD